MHIKYGANLLNFGVINESNLHNVEDFLRYVSDGDYMEAEFVSDQYDAFLIVGNFVPQYIQMASMELQHWLELRLRQRILKKYNKAKKEAKTEDTFDDSILDE